MTFYEKAASVLKNGEEAFGALFGEAPAEKPSSGGFSAEYFTAPRQQAGTRAVNMAFPAWQLEGVRRGCRAVVTSVAAAVRPSGGWLGRVVNAMGEPIDGKGPLPAGPDPVPFRNNPPPAHARQRVGSPLDLGVRALNTFTTCCTPGTRLAT